MHHHLRPDPSGAQLISSFALSALGLGIAVALGVRTEQLALAVRSPGVAPGVDVLVELGVVAIGALLAGWLGVSAALAAACLVARTAGHVWRDGERLVTRLGPAIVRRMLTVTVAAGIGLGTAMGAQALSAVPASVTVITADPGDLGWPVTDPTAVPGEQAASPTAPAPTVGTPTTETPTEEAPTVERPTEEAPADATPATTPTAVPVPSGAGATSRVVVQPGDTLWDIARRSLPEGASEAQIADAWPAWYEANRQTVGADPDLIQPGQVLLAPAEGA
ncbi:MAG: LysM peptidoglycan-binding domain-containing protein [Cellulomonas sp.]|nr:LysM peptidoglycan-binding domain-containing protein [Actinomycetota bacterium]MCG2799365.1 LysM peptidoglycan-binding domain-containing protein [Cellulomonas sp.]